MRACAQMHVCIQMSVHVQVCAHTHAFILHNLQVCSLVFSRPAYIAVQGEGRAAVQSRPLLLGEALPPLRLAFKDGIGNGGCKPPATSAITLEVGRPLACRTYGRGLELG